MNKVLPIAIAFTIMNCGHLNHDFNESKREMEKSKSPYTLNLGGESTTPVGSTPSATTSSCTPPATTAGGAIQEEEKEIKKEEREIKEEGVEIQQEEREIQKEKVEIQEWRKQQAILFSNIDKWYSKVFILQDLFSNIHFYIKKSRNVWPWLEGFTPKTIKDYIKITRDLDRFFDDTMKELYEFFIDTIQSPDFVFDKMVYDHFFSKFDRATKNILERFMFMKAFLESDLVNFQKELSKLSIKLERSAFHEMTQKDFEELINLNQEHYEKLGEKNVKLLIDFHKWTKYLCELLDIMKKLYQDEFKRYKQPLLQQQ